MKDSIQKGTKQQKAPPKRRNAPRTKANILTAAQQAFSEEGYSQAGIRSIAAIADISSPLLLRYYGSKAGLFEAALIESMTMGGLLEGDRSQFGQLLAGLFMDKEQDIKAPSIVALSAGSSEAREIATRVTREQVLEPLAAWLGGENAQQRALEIIILAMGFVMFTRQFPLLEDKELANQSLVDWFTQSVQTIVDQS